MAPPPVTGRNETTGNNVRITRRTARNGAMIQFSGGASDENVEQNDKAPPNDSDHEEQPEGTCGGTVASLTDDDCGETVRTAGNTVAAVVITPKEIGTDTPSTPQVTAEQSLSKHEQDVGSLLSIDNCRELARKRAMEDLFSTFKFPPKDEHSILLYQIKMMEKLGYTALATHHQNFIKNIWPELVSEITEGLRCRRSTITEALDKRVVGTFCRMFASYICVPHHLTQLLALKIYLIRLSSGVQQNRYRNRRGNAL